MKVLTASRVGQLFLLLARTDKQSTDNLRQSISSVVFEQHMSGNAEPVFGLQEVMKSRLLGATVAISPQIIVQKTELFEKFCGFREKAFIAKSPAAKEEVFKEFLFDDSLANHIATSWDEHTLAEFFAYMRTRAPFIRENVATSGQVRVLTLTKSGKTEPTQQVVSRTPKRITTALVCLSRIVSHKKDHLRVASQQSASFTTKSNQSVPRSRSVEMYTSGDLFDEVIGSVPEV
jgi:hypothetical protein